MEETNIVRQGFFPSQIGQPKVEALEDHLRKLNPDIDFTGITRNFLEMSREEQDSVFADGDIFCFFTDSFPAQSGGNLLALRYGKPAIWAGFYEKSQCAEIVFTIPGVTPACFRCAVNPRYEAQLNARGRDQGFITPEHFFPLPITGWILWPTGQSNPAQ